MNETVIETEQENLILNGLNIGTVETGTEAGATITGQAPNQYLNLTLPKGDAFTYEDFTEEQLASLKGDAFTYEDFTEEQLANLKGEKGNTGTSVEAIEATDEEEAITLSTQNPNNIYFWEV